jgi:hypothetical protein
MFRRKIASEAGLGKILRAKFMDEMTVDTLYCSFVKHFPELQGLSKEAEEYSQCARFHLRAAAGSRWLNCWW